ncbi:MAG: SRPBCC family protein [Marinibacterium sp.]
MTGTETDLSLEITRHLPYPPERVFDAWLDPVLLARFMVPGPGMRQPQVTTDPRVGGTFTILMDSPSEPNGWPHRGEYLIIDRPNRLQFTWVSAFTQDDSTVTLDFTPRDGGTDLRLTHIRFPHEESRTNHESGWTEILAQLENAL